MIKNMKTIEQYKIMKHIQENFVISEIEYKLTSENTIEITDKTGDNMKFSYENGEIIEIY